MIQYFSIIGPTVYVLGAPGNQYLLCQYVVLFLPAADFLCHVGAHFYTLVRIFEGIGKAMLALGSSDFVFKIRQKDVGGNFIP